MVLIRNRPMNRRQPIRWKATLYVQPTLTPRSALSWSRYSRMSAASSSSRTRVFWWRAREWETYSGRWRQQSLAIALRQGPSTL
ncbi:MAG: hypothetical protein GXY82_11095 [Methanospirillum sp.]|nr:hypothetical protein [Methanospirillum sp.]